MAVPFAGVGATITARAAGADPTVPSAPRGASAVPSGSTGAKVSWTAPANDGGSTITGYNVIPFDHGAQAPQVFNSPATTATLVGLSKAHAYKFKVVATNGVGNSVASSFTGAIVIGSPGQPPRPTVKKHGKYALDVFFKPPTNTNGAPITRYIASCKPVRSTTTTAVIGHSSPITVTGTRARAIRPGHTYQCVIRAANGRGPSVPSKPSAKIQT